MSSASKAKRGESGVSNAKSIAFRYSGGGCFPKHLAATMRTIGGQAEKIGRPREGSAWDKPHHGLTYNEACAAERYR